MLKRIILLVLLATGSSVMAQQIAVKSLKLLPDDHTATEQPVLDNRNDPCALVKIDAGGLKGLFFPKKGRDHKEDYFDKKTGLYHVYIPTGTKRLAYNHTDYIASEINFSDYIEQLEAGKTYLLTIQANSLNKAKGVVIISATPSEARVEFDGKEVPTAADGLYTFNVEPGTHSYTIRADNHVSQRGTVEAEAGKEKRISADLEWIRHSVTIDCNVNYAQISIDNVYYGKPGKFRLPQGKHTISIKTNDNEHLDTVETVNISANTSHLYYELKKNKNTKIIGAVEVTIFSLSNSTRIYKNQRQIKEWKKNGDVVKFMPGKYLLSDDNYNEYKLVVKKGAAPMTIKF